MNMNSILKGLLRSRYAKVITVLLLLSLTASAVATVYTFYYANVTSAIKAPDLTLVAGRDSTSSCSAYPCATVTVASTGDVATVTMSMFPADTSFSPPPASYYSDLINVTDANNAHSIKAVQIYSITNAANLGTGGQITVYYCTAQTEFAVTGSLVTSTNCDSYSFTSTGSTGTVSGTITFPLSISAGTKQYIELAAYAGSGTTVGNTVSFSIAVQWV
jgi:hypothetical protein